MTDRSGKDQFQVEPCQPSASFSHYWSVAINVHLFVHNTLAPHKHSGSEQILFCLKSKSLTFPDLELLLDQSGVAQHLIRSSIYTHQILPHLHIGPGLQIDFMQNWVGDTTHEWSF